MPAGSDRQTLLPGALAFDSSQPDGVDEALIENLPVAVTYYDVGDIEAVLRRVEDHLYAFRESGTTHLYRLLHGHVMYSGGEWLDGVRARLRELPARFWTQIAHASRMIFERAVRRLSAAAPRGDDLFFLSSFWSCVHAVVSYLFAGNRLFEPSGRMLQERVRALPELPEGFAGRLEMFLRQDDAVDQAQKREIAELIAKSLLHLA